MQTTLIRTMIMRYGKAVLASQLAPTVAGRRHTRQRATELLEKFPPITG